MKNITINISALNEHLKNNIVYHEGTPRDIQIKEIEISDIIDIAGISISFTIDLYFKSIGDAEFFNINRIEDSCVELSYTPNTTFNVKRSIETTAFIPMNISDYPNIFKSI